MVMVTSSSSVVLQLVGASGQQDTSHTLVRIAVELSQIHSGAKY